MIWKKRVTSFRESEPDTAVNRSQNTKQDDPLSQPEQSEPDCHTAHPDGLIGSHSNTAKAGIMLLIGQMENSSMRKYIFLDTRWLNFGVQTQRQLWIFSLNLTLAPQATS